MQKFITGYLKGDRSGAGLAKKLQQKEEVSITNSKFISKLYIICMYYVVNATFRSDYILIL